MKQIELKLTDLPNSTCSSCGKVLCGATSFEGCTPEPGNISVCSECGHVMAFDAQLHLRELTDDEIIAVAGNEGLLLAQKFVRFRRWRREQKDRPDRRSSTQRRSD